MLKRRTKKHELMIDDPEMIPITHPIAQEYIMKCFRRLLEEWEKLDKEGKIGPPTYNNTSNIKTTM